MSDPTYLLDTDTFVYIRRGRPTEALEKFRQLQPGDAALSVITYGELVYGIEKSQQGFAAFHLLDQMTELIAVLPLPEQAARVYGSIRATLARKGEAIGANDLWIAAHAMTAGLILVSNNVREFRRVPGLKLENWVE